MRIKALVSFAGQLTMRRGEEREYGDNAVLQDLLKAGFVTELTETTKTAAKAKRGAKANEGK